LIKYSAKNKEQTPAMERWGLLENIQDEQKHEYTPDLTTGYDIMSISASVSISYGVGNTKIFRRKFLSAGPVWSRNSGKQQECTLEVSARIWMSEMLKLNIFCTLAHKSLVSL
jgi:hypothetical protein